MQTPYYEDELLTLYHGDALDLLPRLPYVDAIITDPPYGETSLDWDAWPNAWPDLAARLTSQLWCFGSLRLFMNKAREFANWRVGQDIVWHKHNGSSPKSDRFRRTHELAVHFYNGEWNDLYKSPQHTYDAVAKTVRRNCQAPHWGAIANSSYASEEGGPRMMTSVIFAKSCHGYAVNETQKPEAIVAPLMLYSVRPGGLVLDCFAGSGTTLAVARKMGYRAIGIEKRESQCEAIARRLAQGDLLSVANL